MSIQVMNNSHKSVVDRRRTMVARLVLRGLAQREIVKWLLEKTDLRNGDGRPWSLATVNRDIKAVRKGWQEEARSTYGLHVARMLAEYRELRREGWRTGDLDLVMRVCVLECKLLGLDQPDQLKVTWREEAEAEGVDAGAIFEQLVGEAAALLDGGGGSGGAG